MQINHSNVYHKKILWQWKRGCGNMFLISIVSSTNGIGFLTSPSVDFFLFFLPFTSWTRHHSLSKLFNSLTDHDFGRSWQNEYQFQQQSTPPAAFLDRRIFYMQWQEEFNGSEPCFFAWRGEGATTPLSMHKYYFSVILIYWSFTSGKKNFHL